MQHLKLVEDWKNAWKWLSVQFATLLLVWTTLDTDTQATVVSGIASVIGINVPIPMVLAVMIIVGRLVAQSKGPAP
jgi:hypothetical protein